MGRSPARRDSRREGRQIVKEPSVMLSEAKHLHLSRYEQTNADASLRSPENRTDDVIPAKAGIHLSPNPEWVPAFAGTTAFVTLIPVGGPQAHGHSG